jgi:glycosyltransferase involved in cell wall biosynthesis
MKICLIGTAYPHRGGIAHFNALLFRTLKKRGHKVSFFSFTRQYPQLFFPGTTQMDEGKEAIRVEATPMLDSVDPFSWWRVAMRVRQEQPDLIVFKYWMPFFSPCYTAIIRLATAGRSTKALFVCDNIIPHEPRPGDRLLTHMALASAHYFIVMSRSVEEDLLRFRPDANYKRVEHPVYEIFGSSVPKGEARARLGIAPEAEVLLFFGYIRRYKGLLLLLDALPLVLQQRKVELVVAGEFYDNSEPYFEKIRQRKLEPHVKMVNRFIPNEEVNLFFAAADVVVLPYVSATQSGVIQIAYNFDRPVVATPVGGLPEVIEEGKTGVVAQDRTPEALAGAILRFFSLRKEVDFEREVRQYKQRFSWDRFAQAVEELVESKR